MVDRVGRQLGQYKLLHLLGKGGFSEVYLGEHIYLKTKAAIKILYELTGASQQNFLEEARTIGGLKHPNIVRVLDFGVEDTAAYLVMEYAPKGTLRQRHPKDSQVSLINIIIYVKQIAAALQYAHNQKLIHRDIKPENMLLGPNGEVLLSDFGIAIVAHNTNTQSMKEIVGTLAYMAPEQFTGKPRPASDQYALAVVVYEWLCGSRPFHGNTFEVGSQHLFATPEPLRNKLPQLSPIVERVVLTALAKDPQQRFTNVQEFANSLEKASRFEESFVIPSPISSSQPNEDTFLSHFTQFYSSTTERLPNVEQDSFLNSRNISDLPTINIPLEDKCPYCHAELPQGDKFCQNCNKNIIPTAPTGARILPEDKGESVVGSLIGPTIPKVSSDSLLTIPPNNDEIAEVEDAYNTREDDGDLIPLPYLSIPSNNKFDSPSISLPNNDGIVVDEDIYNTRNDDLLPHSYPDQEIEIAKVKLIEKGDSFYKKENFLDALIIYEQVIELDSLNIHIRTRKIETLLELGRYEEGLIACDHVLQITSDNASIWSTKGKLLYKLRRYKEALDAYDRAVAFRPDELTFWETKANILRKLKLYEEALTIYDHISVLNPNNASVWVTKGKILYKLERYEEALASFVQASLLIPRRTSVWIDKGEVLYKLKRYEEALETYKRALVLKPTDSSISNKCEMLHDLIKHREELAASQLVNRPYFKSVKFNDQQVPQTGSGPSIPSHVVFRDSLQKQRGESGIDSGYYDVFLSHSDLDSEWVEINLATYLEDIYGFHVWLDKWTLVPGESWQPAIAHGLDQAQCCAICIGEQTPIGWFKQEIQRALNRQAKDSHFRVIPVLLPHAKEINIDDFLELKTWVDFRGPDHDRAFHLLVSGIKNVPPGRPPIKETTNTQTISILAEGRLRELQQFREKKLIDESVALEYQRIVLKTLWLGEMLQEKETPNE